MLTVKHIRLSGEEDIYLTPTIRYSPGDDERAIQPSPPTVWISTKGDDFCTPLTGGTVFVMNDAGKTVARYDIGASMVPTDEPSPVPSPVPYSTLAKPVGGSCVRAGTYSGN